MDRIMVSNETLVVAVVVVWYVGLALGYWFGVRSERMVSTWLLELLRKALESAKQRKRDE
jgi:ABC-type dipeptide/oligopeptide/nickel transport system permease component